MTNRSLAGIAVLIVANGLLGCGVTSAPTAPSAVSQPKAAEPIVFTDPLTGLSTSDVRDAQDHVVQFTTTNELVWIDGTRLPGHYVSGPGHQMPVPTPSTPMTGAPEASCQCWFVVRFGATAGERRAYLTGDVGHFNPGTLVNLDVTGSALVVSWSERFPPGTYTLSGVITEVTATGLVPLENAEVSRLNEEQGGWDYDTTDKNGFYQLQGLSDGSRETSFSKEGYQTIRQANVPIHGDTRIDVQLVR
jgi:hypothetical protein